VSVTHGPFRPLSPGPGALLERFVPALLAGPGVGWWSGTANPRGPVSVELYPKRELFRCDVGLPNYGIQGVCFGRSVAAMSPGDEVFILGYDALDRAVARLHILRSRSRVPRWFNEGLAEWETLIAEPAGGASTIPNL
jgi:hypothetical protein